MTFYLMSHRLKEIRKLLGLSQEQFGAAVESAIGGSDKWPFQKVSRLEVGETDLDVPMITQICKAFPQIEPWHFLADPEKVYPNEHKQVVAAYMALDNGIKMAVDQLMFGEKKNFELNPKSSNQGDIKEINRDF